MKQTLFYLFPTLLISTLHGQQYQCGWSVVGTGGTTMTNNNYWCGSTAGQIAIGKTSNGDKTAYIGFWYPENLLDINEGNPFSGNDEVYYETRLYPIGLGKGKIKIQYSLGQDERIEILICDVNGRIVRRLKNLLEKKGIHSVTWDGRDDDGRTVKSGIYFLKFSSGKYKRNLKLLLMN